MKIKLDIKNCLYPMPTTLVGANVNDRPNYISIAHVGIPEHDSISLSMNKSHYTNNGIKENKTFSVNIPSMSLVKETDYCGIHSGKQIDKSKIFTTFYGSLITAPMIEECVINMECRLVKIVDFPQHDLFIGEIVKTYCDDNCLSDGIVDLQKVNPILFSMFDRSYWGIGEKFAKAWEVGKNLE